MNLVIDIGNTKITYGIFDNNKLIKRFGFRYSDSDAQENFESEFFAKLKDLDIKNCIISSVVDEVTETVRNAVYNVIGVVALILTSDLNLEFKIDSETPQKIGADRISNIAAAFRLYNQRPIIVVDCGSATTFDILDKNGNFIGGLIFSGLYMNLKALAANTSKLPELNLDMADSVRNIINDETQNGILSGVINGHAQAIQGLIVLCENEIGEKTFVIGTGGDAEFIGKYMNYRKFDVVNPNLTLEGLNIILENNLNSVI